jgi:hypothetical protein
VGPGKDSAFAARNPPFCRALRSSELHFKNFSSALFFSFGARMLFFCLPGQNWTHTHFIPARPGKSTRGGGWALNSSYSGIDTRVSDTHSYTVVDCVEVQQHRASAAFPITQRPEYSGNLGAADSDATACRAKEIPIATFVFSPGPVYCICYLFLIPVVVCISYLPDSGLYLLVAVASFCRCWVAAKRKRKQENRGIYP